MISASAMCRYPVSCSGIGSCLISGQAGPASPASPAGPARPARAGPPGQAATPTSALRDTQHDTHGGRPPQRNTRRLFTAPPAPADDDLKVSVLLSGLTSLRS